ncbi:MAG: HAD hydrolase family protein [Phycisphaeraceae bacterium]|nr:HAD hydrolase family protein [Phycisphaerales bacterium]QOJ17605.1 MAG: HAD hydrolase family protein [Phycisphaeraceae bacterium]
MADDPGEIRLLCLDVDGVLTDGGIFIDDQGVETKRYHVRDGSGLVMWRKLGYQTALISGRTGMCVTHRARELGIRHVLLGVPDKGEAVGRLATELDIPLEQVAAMGDDLPDLPMLRMVGYPMAVADACREVRETARFVTVRPGGFGAVREAVEHLLKAHNRWSDALALFGIQDHD